MTAKEAPNLVLVKTISPRCAARGRRDDTRPAFPAAATAWCGCLTRRLVSFARCRPNPRGIYSDQSENDDGRVSPAGLDAEEQRASCWSWRGGAFDAHCAQPTSQALKLVCSWDWSLGLQCEHDFPAPAVAASCFCCCAGALGSESDIARLSSGTSSRAPSGITSMTLFRWSTHA